MVIFGQNSEEPMGRPSEPSRGKAAAYANPELLRLAAGRLVQVRSAFSEVILVVDDLMIHPGFSIFTSFLVFFL